MDPEKIFARNGVIFEDSGRYYLENLSKRDYDLEFSTPHKLTIFDNTICENAWGEMIRSLMFLLLQKFPSKTSSLLNFESPWTKQKMFLETPKSNAKPLADRLYVNCNHTALHACWFIEDIINFYQIAPEQVRLIIHRPPAAEPEEIKRYFRAKFKTDFSIFLKEKYEKSPNDIAIILSNIENHLNKWLSSISQGYNDFFLFENITYVDKYSKDTLNAINSDPSFDEKYKRICVKTMSYVVEFYRLISIQ